jgi:hypothetical protein
MSDEDENEKKEDTNIRVAVRCRPLNGKERNNGEQTCVRIHPGQIVLNNPSNQSDEHMFGFDLVFGEDSTQEEVWEKVGTPVIEKSLSGFNCTIFACTFASLP